MRYIIPILFLCFFAACSSTEEVEIDFLKITLIDTFDNELVFDTASQLKKTIYHPFYIGEFQKEIHLEYLTDSVKIEHYYPNEIHENSNGSSTIIYVKYKYPSSNDLKIFVDTSKIIGSGMDRRSTYGMTKEDILSYNFKGKYKSHPVFIENISNDTLSIGFGNRIFPIVEAKDSLGNWRPIQERGIYYCGTGVQDFYLKPKHLLISSCRLYDGDFKTKLKLVFVSNGGVVESNEFEGTINYQQFERRD